MPHELVFAASSGVALPTEAQNLKVGDYVTGISMELITFIRRIEEVQIQTDEKVALIVRHAPLKEIFDELDLDGSFSLTNKKSKIAQASRRLWGIKLPKIKIPNPIHVIDDIVDGAGDIGEDIVDGAGDIGEDIVDGVGDIGEDIVDGVGDIADDIEDSVIKPVKEAGLTVISATSDLAVDAWEWVEKQIDTEFREEIDIINLSDYFYEDLNDSTSLEGSCELDTKLMIEIKITSNIYRVALQADYSGSSLLRFEAQDRTTIEKRFEIWKGSKRSETFYVLGIPVEVNWTPKVDVDAHVEVAIEAQAKVGALFRGDTRAEIAFKNDKFETSFEEPSINPEYDVNLEVGV